MDRWRQAILSDAPHVLIYPEIGMDPASVGLAAQRLAPVQCTSWGHPETSGFPTLDYFLSSDLMEPPDAQNHYTARLVRLPNLGGYYEPPVARPVSLTRADIGLRASSTVFWSGQSLYKYLPQFDQVFARIARKVPDCQFAFIQHPKSAQVTKLFWRRLEQAFSGLGLRADNHCVILPRLDDDRFMAAIGLCDIVLDSIGWSGFNSTMEGLTHDRPIVTMTAPLMRGRHTTAILTMMGVAETIAENIDDYVSTAVRLARDLPWRSAVGQRIAANKSRIYRDRMSISALEDFLDRVVRPSR
jgi:predicted O-linked N-acetylglucosamine transferase (SPINDLY family)